MMLIPIDDEEALEIWDHTCPDGFAREVQVLMRRQREKDEDEQ